MSQPPLPTYLHPSHHASLQTRGPASRQTRDPASPSDSWLIFSILVAIAAAAALMLVIMWATEVLILRRRRLKAPAEGTELATIGGPLRRDSNDDNTADYHGRSGRGSSGDDLASAGQKSINDDAANFDHDELDDEEGFPARPPRAYGRSAEEAFDGMVPVKGVEMV